MPESSAIGGTPTSKQVPGNESKIEKNQKHYYLSSEMLEMKAFVQMIGHKLLQSTLLSKANGHSQAYVSVRIFRANQSKGWLYHRPMKTQSQNRQTASSAGKRG